MDASETSSDQVALWTPGRLKVAIASAEVEQTFSIDRPFAVVRCDGDGRLSIAKACGGQRVVYLHGTAHGVYAVTLAASRRGRNGPRGIWLAAADVLQINDSRLRAWMENDDRDKATNGARRDLLSPAIEPGEAPLLEITSPVDREVVERRLLCPLTILGRGLKALVQIDEPSVSPVHAVLYQQTGRLWVVDLFSRAGTALNGRPVQAAEAVPGDLLEVGAVQVRWSRGASKRVDQMIAGEEEHSPEPSSATEGFTKQNTEHGQRPELRGSLEAMNQESIQDLDKITKGLFEQQQKQTQLIEALAQCEKRWEDRLNDLHREIVVLGTQSTEALEKVGQRLENERAHRHQVKRELAKMQETSGQPSQSDPSTAEALEAYQARLETTEHELSNLKQMLKRLTAALEQSKPASDAQTQRQEALESVQESHETRLQKFGQRVDKLSHAVNQFHDHLVTEQTQNGEIRANLEANQEQLSQLLKRTKQNDRTLQLVSAHQEEMAERIAEMNREWLERITALEASWKKRSAPQLTHSMAAQHDLGEFENPDSRPRASTVVVVKGSKKSFQGNRLDDMLPSQPSLDTLQKVEHPDEETSEATDRLLNRQLDRDEAEDVWRRRFRLLLALTLAGLGVAVAWQYWG